MTAVPPEPRVWAAPQSRFHDDILAAHRAALAADEDGYDDPQTGLFVFTSSFLASRECCDNGCRHCPYRD